MIAKILTWVRMNGASILGMIQVGIKAVKEILTAIMNALSIIMPASSAEKVILKIREVVETIDEVVEKIKAWLLAVVL